MNEIDTPTLSRAEIARHVARAHAMRSAAFRDLFRGLGAWIAAGIRTPKTPARTRIKPRTT